MPNAHIAVDEGYDGRSPLGSQRMGYTTYTEVDDYLVEAIRKMFQHLSGDRWRYFHGWPVITVSDCWSGYSEYTITSRWDEISIEWDGRGVHYASMGEFFAAALEAEKWADG
ncbi:hypothetical protein A5630_25250 [Mycolicibacterium mucogenicum]|uniref:Uncharacterized protein n=1 Tax=Mycolicibacterium mucogenicum TaxID=56689 RepID=A0A1A3GWQ6_MYCMU|nr:hypothetical protein [Mycolicibacterium mucogenicum]OBJ40260.1 hypothetical protein A5630_25250 [Mycolicibacterium mucogenicum]